MKKICVFAGTSQARSLIKGLEQFSATLEVTACVATSYGQQILEGFTGKLLSGRLNAEEMEELFKSEKFNLIIDATHPFATEVTSNILKAAKASGTDYIRLIRNKEEGGNAIYFSSHEEAANYLNSTQGNILLTIGSKDLAKYSIVNQLKERVYIRILPMKDSLEICEREGISPQKIIAMQGPFSYELNCALIKSLDIKYIVTKESGGGSGFVEKIEAADSCKATALVIGQPAEEKGVPLHELKAKLIRDFSLKYRRKVRIVGVGTGGMQVMTAEAKQAVKEAEIVIGAKRIAENCAFINPNIHISYKSDEIKAYLEENIGYENIVIAVSGDVGFYSAANSLKSALSDFDVDFVCGISTPIYFASKLGTPWQDMPMLSLHGRKDNIVHYVSTHPRVFALTGGEMTVKAVLDELVNYNLNKVNIYIGEMLSTDQERITKGTAEELQNTNYHSISAIIIENPLAENKICQAIPDSEFLREQGIPMTKSEVRTLSISKLTLNANSVVYDIGAGSGSVSIEAANVAYKGTIYAIERKAEAVELIKENMIKHKTANVVPVHGIAPDALNALPTPTHAFIGGSAGNLNEILTLLLAKNPNVKIVLNAVTAETIAEATSCIKEFGFTNSEIVSVNTAKSRKLGSYHLMEAQNPVYIFTFSCQ